MTVGPDEGACDNEGAKLGDPDGLVLGAEEATGVGFELGIEDTVGLELGVPVGTKEGLFISATRRDVVVETRNVRSSEKGM